MTSAAQPAQADPDPSIAGASRLGFRVRAVDLADVLAYLVVLGLFVQFFPAVISESFALTLLTAVLLKLALGLGGFFLVTLLVISLMLVRAGVRLLVRSRDPHLA